MVIKSLRNSGPLTLWCHVTLHKNDPNKFHTVKNTDYTFEKKRALGSDLYSVSLINLS